MTADYRDTDEFRDARFTHVDLSGATFRDCDLRRVKIVDSWLTDLKVSGEFGNVRVNDVDVTGYVEGELDRRHPERVQVREMRTADDYRAAWATLERLWAQTISRAERLPEPMLHEQVDDEWSLVQTLRHLVFATDAWVRRAVLDEPAPYHPLGLTHTGCPPDVAAALGIDLTADPSYAEVLSVRADRLRRVHDVVDALTGAALDRTTTQSPTPGHPEQVRTVGYCLRVTMTEECEHRRYAERDLSVLEARDHLADPGA
jgi:hypothetical protein